MWTRLPEVRKGEVFRKNFDYYRVVKDHKIVLVGRETPTLDGALHFYLVAFPKKEHIPVFGKASNGVRVAGPASSASGAVGTLSCLIPKEGPASLGFVQAHYTTRKGSFAPLSRSLATYYGGWRLRCLNEAVALVKKHGRDLLLPAKRTPKLEEEIRSVCGKLGVKIVSVTNRRQ